MKKLVFLITLLSLYFSLHAQKTSSLYLPPKTSDMPEWATFLYDENPNAIKIEEAYQAYYKTHPFVKNEWTKYYKRWIMSNRAYFDANGNVMESDAKALRTASTSVGNRAANWTPMGPLQTHWLANDNSAQPMCPWQTNVYSIDIAQSNPNILFCTSETGGVFKTTDKGLTWTPVGSSFFTTTQTAVAIAPTNENIIYCGNSKEIVKSTDGGITWTVVFTLDTLNTTDIKISKANPNIVLITGYKGLFRTTNGGASWTQIFTKQCYDLSFKPDDANVVYVLKRNTSTTPCELYKSSDAGATFTLQNSGWITGVNDEGARMTTSSANSNYIYVVLLTSSGPRVMKSTDAASTWTLAASGNTSSLGMSNGQGYYDLSIVASPTNADHVIVATTTAYKSTNGGTTYSTLGGYSGPFSIHPDIQEMVALGGDSWIATDGGITYSTDFFTATSNAQTRMAGVNGADYWGFDIGWNDDVMVGGRYHNGNSAWKGNYPSGQMLRMGGGEAATGYVNPGNNRKVYYSDIGGKILPNNFNENASSFNIGKYPNESYYTFHSSAIKFDPRYYETMFLGNGNQFFKSTDGGASFVSLLTSSDAGASLEGFDICFTNPDYIYVNQRSNTLYDGKIWKTSNGGSSWTVCTNPTGTSNGDRRVAKVVVSPTNPNVIWVAYASGGNGKKIYKSTDGGSSWTNLSITAFNNKAVLDIALQYGTNNGIYIVLSNGTVYYKNDDISWQSYNTNLPLSLSGLYFKAFYKESKIRLSSNLGIWQSDFYENSSLIAQPMVDKSLGKCSRDTFFFDDHSVVNHASATWSWNFPGATYVSSTSIRNPKVVYPNGTYTATLTVSDGSSTNTGTLQVTVASECDADTIRGNAAYTTGDNAWVSIPAFNESDNDMTFTAWVKMDGVQPDYSPIFMADGGAAGLHFQPGNNHLGFHWPNGPWWWDSGHEVISGEWTHVALVAKPTSITIYKNGQPSTYAYTLGAKDFSTNIFRLMNYQGWGGRYAKGEIDEVCIFNRSLSTNEIRDLMHLTKKPTEDASLIRYYQFNESSGYVLDKVGSAHATLVGNSSRVNSSGPFGGGVSARVSVTSGGTKTFGSTGLSLQFPATGTYPNGDLIAYRINLPPHNTPTTNLLPQSYWVIRNYGTNSTFSNLVEMKFSNISGLTSGDAIQPAYIKLYKRGNNDFGNTWGAYIDEADAVSMSGSFITFNAGLTLNSFSQFAMTRESFLPLQLIDFKAFVVNNAVSLVWNTLNEERLVSYEIERSEDAINFSYIGTAFAKNSATAFYSEKDFTVVNGKGYYYRLKIKEMDGSYHYSSIRYVFIEQNEKQEIVILPNPNNGDMTLLFHEMPSGEAVLTLLDVTGRKVHTQVVDIQDANYSVTLHLKEQLSAGTYQCSILGNNWVRTLPFVVFKEK